MGVGSCKPAVDNDWTRFMFLHDSPVEGQDGRGIVGHSVVRPGCEVELSHFQTPIRASLQLYTHKKRLKLQKRIAKHTQLT